MTLNTILLSDFTDPRFQTAFRTYFTELNIPVKDWDGLFREMNEEKGSLAYLLLDDHANAAGFLLFQMTSFSNWFFEERFGFIREFWVAPAHRRQGHGKTLLGLAETFFLEHGACRSILTADDAAAFYLANGYQRMPGVIAKNNMEVLAKNLLKK